MTGTVLVTGGTGYVATWVIAGLLKRGYQVRTTVRSLAKEAVVRNAVASGGNGGQLTFAVADLMQDDGWDAAVAGCDYVLHVASPLGAGKDGDLTGPARDGTLRVLKAAMKAGVKRVVFTSSCAACASPLQGPDSFNDESVWTDPNDPDSNAYRRSKVLAEVAAWEFMKTAGGSTELTTILPSAVFGPMLIRNTEGSVGVIDRLVQGKMPGLPRIGFCVVDVRDLAEAHILAMTAPEAAGQRLIATGEFMWMEDVAKALRAGLGARGGKVPTRKMPSGLVKLMAAFVPSLRAIAPTLGRRHVFNPAKAERLLGWKSRPAAETIVACGESLLAE